MFDTLYIRPTQEVTRNTTIIEKRAPTDESVRLLKEMESEARKKILDSIRVDDNEFKCVIHRYDDFENSLIWMAAIFSLNGRKIEAKVSCNSICNDIEDIKIKLRDAVAEKIANEIAGAFNFNKFGI